jgi:hypothetical protein
MRKFLQGVAAAVLVAAPLAVVAAPANANPGDELIVNGDFSQYDHATGAITDGVTTTSFQLTTSLDEAHSPGGGDMYDPGRYAVSTNPGSLHNQWVEYAGDNPKMVLNGFTEGVQTVWQQSAAGTVCTTPGSTLAYEFKADVANVLPLDQYSDGGANIEVIINGVSLGSADLTANDGTPVTISGGAIPAVNPMDIKIVNHATQYIGNDFSLDNLSLKQVGDCVPPSNPSVGGKTIGYYKNHPVSEATWDAARAPYGTVLGGLPNWSNALAALNAATSSDQGQSMLLAQYIGTVLNAQTIPGYKTQGIDTDGLLGVGECATVSDFLAAVNSAWGTAALDTKAERVAVKNVLDRANQDVPLAPLQCDPTT